MPRFRILHVIRPAAGGMKKHLLSLLVKSNRDIFEPLVACSAGKMADELSHLGFTVIPLPLRGELSFASDLSTVRQLVTVLKEHEITIIHAHSSKAGLVGRLAAYLARTPIIFMTVHNSIFYEEWPAWKKWVFAFAERMLARYTDCIITVSQSLQKELISKESLDPEKVVTIYNGIDAEHFYPLPERRFILRSLGLPLSGQLVGTVARLAPQKGITYFLKAAAMLIRDYQVSFVVVGDGPLRHQLQAEATSLGLEKHLIFTGERNDVPSILSALDVFVLPSLSEGLPLTVLEAMAVGRPVVATRVGGIPEIVQDKRTGLLVEPADPAGLAWAIGTLLTDQKKAASLGQEGQIRVKERFTVDNMVYRVEEEYKKVLMAKGLF